MNKNLRLWYRQSAQAWVEALPLGNGRMGAMVFGGVEKERIALNEDTLWSGFPHNTNDENAYLYFRKAQELIAQGKHDEAQLLIEAHLEGPYGESYMPLGDLLIDFYGLEETKNYERELRLEDGAAEVRFIAGKAAYKREMFLSYPDQALVIRFSADQPGSISCDVSLSCQLHHEIAVEDSALWLRGICPSRVEPQYLNIENAVSYAQEDEKKGVRFAAAVRAENQGGSLEYTENSIRARNADALVLKLTARSSFNGFEHSPFLEGKDEYAAVRQGLKRLEKKDWQALWEAHLKDYRPYYQRVSLDLSNEKYEELPTDERLIHFPSQQDDRGLIELMFQYGRYLMIAGSREGSQPLNLQGIWNQKLRAPWSSNYTVNINTEMNYWPAEICNLSEMHGPLFDMLDDLMIAGAKTAQAYYAARGVAVHHNVDLWRLSNPVGNHREGSAVYAFWPMGFGWMCQHLYEHYLFTGDREFLKKRALPCIREAARFYLDTMAQDAQGRRFVSPATSPENHFMIKGKDRSVSKAAAMSNAIVREVLGNYLAILSILNLEEPMAEEAREALPCIYPFEIGSKGQLLEWDQEFEEVDIHHRHVSHLYGLHPGRQITWEKTPDLAAACQKSLEIRGDESTGWAMGWRINLWARLGDGDHALKLIKNQLRYVESTVDTVSQNGGTYMNLFDAHPPFQIDGNFGVCAGIAEMLLQSDEQAIHLLPALPKEWQQGSVKGLRTRCGAEVEIEFEKGTLKKARLLQIVPRKAPVRVTYGMQSWNIAPKANEWTEIVP